jgi:hypothetical protein
MFLTAFYFLALERISYVASTGFLSDFKTDILCSQHSSYQEKRYRLKARRRGDGNSPLLLVRIARGVDVADFTRSGYQPAHDEISDP